MLTYRTTSLLSSRTSIFPVKQPLVYSRQYATEYDTRFLSESYTDKDDSAFLASDPTKIRVETDSYGPLDVPGNKYWGAQTQRYHLNR